MNNNTQINMIGIFNHGTHGSGIVLVPVTSANLTILINNSPTNEATDKNAASIVNMNPHLFLANTASMVTTIAISGKNVIPLIR